ncbi:sortase A [Paenibacillus sp. DS2015]|uniref:class D sortase n=1 Tax=Paenibacillus sp. DS2015 TaxID=3373917 RepID=UPI003D1ECBA3
MRKKLSYIFIIVGILVIISPKLMEWNADRQQNELLKEVERLESNDGITVAKDVQVSYEQLSQLLEESSTSEEVLSTEAVPTDNEDKAVGLITIDIIDLKLPIMEGATKANMKLAAAHMVETTPLGQVGNAAIAAHRAHTQGRLFNRLNEIGIDDEIVVNTNGEKYIYTVFKVTVVEPTDVSVLEGNEKDKWLTLITCDPLVNPTHRLIVQARMK